MSKSVIHSRSAPHIRTAAFPSSHQRSTICYSVMRPRYRHSPRSSKLFLPMHGRRPWWKSPMAAKNRLLRPSLRSASLGCIARQCVGCRGGFEEAAKDVEQLSGAQQSGCCRIIGHATMNLSSWIGSNSDCFEPTSRTSFRYATMQACAAFMTRDTESLPRPSPDYENKDSEN